MKDSFLIETKDLFYTEIEEKYGLKLYFLPIFRVKNKKKFMFAVMKENLSFLVMKDKVKRGIKFDFRF